MDSVLDTVSIMKVNVLPLALLHPTPVEASASPARLVKFGMEANVSPGQLIQLTPWTLLIQSSQPFPVLEEPGGTTNNLDAYHAQLDAPAALTATHATLAALDSSSVAEVPSARRSVVMAKNSSLTVMMETMLTETDAAANAKLRKDTLVREVPLQPETVALEASPLPSLSSLLVNPTFGER